MCGGQRSTASWSHRNQLLSHIKINNIIFDAGWLINWLEFHRWKLWTSGPANSWMKAGICSLDIISLSDAATTGIHASNKDVSYLKPIARHLQQAPAWVRRVHCHPKRQFFFYIKRNHYELYLLIYIYNIQLNDAGRLSAVAFLPKNVIHVGHCLPPNHLSALILFTHVHLLFAKSVY